MKSLNALLLPLAALALAKPPQLSQTSTTKSLSVPPIPSPSTNINRIGNTPFPINPMLTIRSRDPDIRRPPYSYPSPRPETKAIIVTITTTATSVPRSSTPPLPVIPKPSFTTSRSWVPVPKPPDNVRPWTTRTKTMAMAKTRGSTSAWTGVKTAGKYPGWPGGHGIPRVTRCSTNTLVMRVARPTRSI